MWTTAGSYRSRQLIQHCQHCQQKGLAILATLKASETRRLRRRFVGIDLNAGYIEKIALARVERGETGLTRKDQKRGQVALF